VTESVVGSGGELVLFWIIGPLMVVAALALLFARKPVHAAVGLIFVMIGMAFLYTALEAPFLGVAQVVVYTGAIMILFVFVLMLVGVDAADSVAETIRGQRWIAVALGAGLVAVLAGVVLTANLPPAVGLEEANAMTNPVGVAYEIFGSTVFALELVGVLLITAALGAITLTHKERLSAIRDQRATVRLRQRAYARGEGSQVLTPAPAPGVYALHNAADVPALDPEGNPIDISVPRVLRIRGQELAPADVDGHVASIARGTFVQPVASPPAPSPDTSDPAAGRTDEEGGER
jgi:NADH-quinone oxidoreductase subunit J